MVYHRKATFSGFEAQGICSICGSLVLEKFVYEKDYGPEHHHEPLFLCPECGEITKENIIPFSEIRRDIEEEE